MNEGIKIIADQVREELEDTPGIIRKILWLNTISSLLILIKFTCISCVSYFLFRGLTNDYLSVTITFMDWLKLYMAILFTGWGVTFVTKP